MCRSVVHYKTMTCCQMVNLCEIMTTYKRQSSGLYVRQLCRMNTETFYDWELDFFVSHTEYTSNIIIHGVP